MDYLAFSNQYLINVSESATVSVVKSSLARVSRSEDFKMEDVSVSNPYLPDAPPQSRKYQSIDHSAEYRRQSRADSDAGTDRREEYEYPFAGASHQWEGCWGGRHYSIDTRAYSFSNTDDPIHECKLFLHPVDYAETIVKENLEEAANIIATGLDVDVTIPVPDIEVPNIEWPLIMEFNEELGASKIEQYVKTTMITKENWVPTIKFQKKSSDSVSDFYEYETRFSIPTSLYPIPQATASIFFVFEVCRAKPVHCTVDVSFTLEASYLRMYPGKDLISDALLFRVIDSKLALFRRITF